MKIDRVSAPYLLIIEGEYLLMFQVGDWLIVKLESVLLNFT